MACLLLSINCVWPFHILNLKNFQLKKTDVHLHFPMQRAKYNVVVLLLERPDIMWLIWGTVGMLIFYFQMVTHKTFLDLWSLKFLDFDLDDKFLDFIVEKLGVGGFPYKREIWFVVNTFWPRQNGRQFADDIFKWIFWSENIWILNAIWLLCSWGKGLAPNRLTNIYLN